MEAAFQAGIAQASFQVLLEKITDFAMNETSLILGIDDEIRRLQRTLQKIRAILDVVENNQLGSLNMSGNKAWKMWIEDLEKFSYNAEDLLDDISLDLMRANAGNSIDTGKTYQVRSMLLSSFKLRMPHDIRNIRKELEDIAAEINSLFMTTFSGLDSFQVPTKSSLTSGVISVSSLVDEGAVVGREKEKQEIIKMLLTGRCTRSNISVIPLVGMGGIGKTTLAQIAYNNERIVNNFDCRVWISVSVNFDLIRISKSIIESLTGKRCKLSDLDTMQSKLQNLLNGKKFLVVLDDYWTEKYGDWDALCSPFKVGLRGSKVIVTTRSTIVASILGTVPACNLQLLNERECWELIKQRAFSNNFAEENMMHMEHIGRKIAQKCKGLPLAAKSLGGLLCFRSNEDDWETILNSKMWDLEQGNNGIFPALLLSYHCLPAQLRKCFAYCSMFPRNHEFEIDDLVLLWIAEGFIQPRGETRLEDIGSAYFNDLLSRSFFQFSHVNLYSKSIYKMHDLIHSMAQLVSANTCFSMEDDATQCHAEFSNNARHLSLTTGGMLRLVSDASTWCKKLRTFLVMPRNFKGVNQVPYELFLKLPSLRVLDLSCMGLCDIPDSIDYLKHLRYLNLSENHIQNLPESITDLLGLQTLKLRNCFEFLELPANFKNLTNLRHLDLDVKHQLNYMPSDFGNLVNLQTLNAFIVGRGRGCGIGELRSMRFLRGSICITNLENALSVMEANEANLCMKPFLEALWLEWNSPGDKIDQQEVLAGLQPHHNLKELTITNYSGLMFPSWLGDPLYKLRSIHIQSCQNCSILPSLGQLPLLKHLCVENMTSLLHVDHQFSGFGCMKGFPSLELLIFRDMPNLIEFRGLNDDDLPRLLELTFTNCPRLTSLPSLHRKKSLHNLNIIRCPDIQALPEQGLPLSLKTLIVLESAIIKERCRVEQGEDWHKISRIPRVEIDYVEIHTEAPKDLLSMSFKEAHKKWYQ